MAGAAQSNCASTVRIPASRAVVFPDGPSGIAAVGAGRADTLGMSDLRGRRLLATAGPAIGLELVPNFPDPVIGWHPSGGYDAFAFRPEGTNLMCPFNTALKGVMATPSFLATLERVSFTRSNLPDKAISALCH